MLVAVTQIGPESATRQSVTGYHCNVQGVTKCNRSLKQTAISFSSCEAELGLAELFQELHYNVTVRLEMDSDSAPRILQGRGQAPTGWTRGNENEFSGSVHEVYGWTTNAVALNEVWTSCHWRHGRLRACEQQLLV